MDLAKLISQAINKHGELNNAGCFFHHHVELHHSLDYGWSVDEDGEIVHHLVVWEDGLLTNVDVYGVGPDGGHGAFYATVNIDNEEA